MSNFTRPSFQREARGYARFSVATPTASQCTATQGIEPMRIAVRRKAKQGSSVQSNADRHLATGAFPGRFGPNAPHGSADQCNAKQSKEHQSNADRHLEIGVFPGRFGPNASRVIAAQCTALKRMAPNFKATRIGAWQQALFRAVLPIRPGIPSRLFNGLNSRGNPPWP